MKTKMTFGKGLSTIALYTIVLVFILIYYSIGPQSQLIFAATPATVLKPGYTTFSVDSIGLTGRGIELQAAFTQTGSSYLNVYWNSYFIGGSNASIGATCYLNCMAEQDCSSAQQCSQTGLGPAVCTILNPVYKFTEINNVSCRFFNSQYPLIVYKPYPYRTFYPIKFDVFYSPLTTTVGERSKLQVNVKNTGLFKDNYTVKVAGFSPAGTLEIDPSPIPPIGPLTGDSYESTTQTGFTSINLRVVIAQDANICFTVNSTSKPGVNSFYGCAQVKSSFASLSDFNFLGVVWIMILSSALILINKTF